MVTRRISARSRAGLVASAALLALGASGCSGDTAAPEVGRAEGNGVVVVLRYEASSGGDGTLAATFTPDPGFHLYAVDLPPQGVDGIGRPTRLEVRGALIARAPLTVDRPASAERVAGVARPVPVYPAGPVTVRLPVRRSGGGTASAVLGYAACDSTRCLAPVSGMAVPLTLPAA